MNLLIALAMAVQAIPPREEWIVNVGRCEDECDEYLSHQLQGEFAVRQADCAQTHFYVSTNQVGFTDGRVFFIRESRMKRNEARDSIVITLHGDATIIREGVDNAPSTEGTLTLTYNIMTNRLTVAGGGDPLGSNIYIRCPRAAISQPH
jgi:hypothetical protein